MTDRRPPLDLPTSATAELLGVHPSTVKRWADEGRIPASRTEGGHRRFHLRDVLDAAADMGIHTYLDGFNPWQANVWIALQRASREGDFSRFNSLALGWLRQGEIGLLGRLFYEAGKKTEISFTDFLDQAVRGFMALVGEEWRKRRLQIGEEHMATQVVLEAFIRLRVLRQDQGLPGIESTDTPPVALVGSPDGDLHDLGAQAVRAVPEREGWKVYYLGSNTPPEDFAFIQQGQVASLVCISYSGSAGLPEVQRTLGILERYYRPQRPYALALGGSFRGITLEELPAGPFESLFLADSAQAFQDWIRALTPETGSGADRRVA